MPSKPITSKQQQWLQHVKSADIEEGTLTDCVQARFVRQDAVSMEDQTDPARPLFANIQLACKEDRQL